MIKKLFISCVLVNSVLLCSAKPNATGNPLLNDKCIFAKKYDGGVFMDHSAYCPGPNKPYSAIAKPNLNCVQYRPIHTPNTQNYTTYKSAYIVLGKIVDKPYIPKNMPAIVKKK